MNFKADETSGFAMQNLLHLIPTPLQVDIKYPWQKSSSDQNESRFLRNVQLVQRFLAKICQKTRKKLINFYI